MKKIAYLFVMSILVLISSTAYADDGYFTCGSDVNEFSGETFENLVVSLGAAILCALLIKFVG